VSTRVGLKPLLMILMLVLSLGLLVAGCGDDDDGDSGSGETTTEAPADAGATDADTDADAGATVIDIPAAETGLAFAVTEVTAPAGEITLRSVNDQSVPHNIAYEDTLGEVVTDGGVSEITVTITEPGTYEYYCSVPGHREAGMVGTLTVE